MSKSKSISILIVSVMSSVLNSVGLTLLVPILFQSFHINFSSEINGAIKNLFKNYMHWLPGDVGPWMLLFILILFLLKNALTALRVQLVSQLTRVQLLKLRTRLLNHILSKDLHYFVKFGNGTILNHLSTNVEKSSKYFVDSIEYFGMLFQLLAYIIVLAVISWKLCLICAVFSGPLLLLNRRIAKKARILSTEQSYSQANLVQKFNDILIGIRYVKISGREHDHVSWITVQSQVILDRLARMNFLSNITSPITELSAMVLLVAMVTSLSFMGNQSLISVDSFFSYLLILGRAMPLFNGVSSKRIDIASNLGSLLELEKVLQDKLYESNFRGTEQLSKISNGLTFSNVTFSYPETTRNVLNSISFDIKRGESVAIVGPSGSGKSTLIDLLLGFYLPTSGQILVDGIDYKNYDPKIYRNKIALVPQDSVMFFSTIRENLLYLKPKATEIEIWRALDQADLAEFISNLPEGLDTNVGERGIRFSGGQRQRLAIARALLQDPEIIIFDEATSSLDSISESKIVDSIKRASIGRTTITIAHRLATILHCKKIILIEHGWLVEYGTIDELLNINSRFKRYAEAQNLKLSA